MSINLGFIIDWSSWSTYLQAGVAAVLAWMVKTQIQQGKDQVKLQTVMEFYVERQTRDAAIRLDVPNPAPPEIRVLLQKRIQGEPLTDDERPLLVTWLKTTGTDPKADGAERSAALQLLTGLQTKKLFAHKRRWWQWSREEAV
jgi:nucleoid-associated protein YgaU